MNGTIVISGSIAQKPWQGGHTWVFLQYVLGLRRLGWNVLFVDRLEESSCRDQDGRPCRFEQSANAAYFSRIMKAVGLRDSSVLLCGDRAIGLSRKEVEQRTEASAFLLNVMGFLRDPEILDRAVKRVFLDIDPGFGQMWQELGLCALFSGHHHYVTIGENVGQPGCGVPTCGLDWIPTRQPVVLEQWDANGARPGGPFTTVGSWRGAYGPVPYAGRTYGLRVHEFRKFAALPARVSGEFELALDIHAADAADRALLQDNGWRLVDPRQVAGDPWEYRRYVAGSSAEFMVAKNMYVETQSGWFSDRSICYLAAGRPVLAQDTGFRSLYPCGKGLLTFRSIDEAVESVKELSSDYVAHARAARSLAEEYFDSDKVLCRLLQKLGVN